MVTGQDDNPLSSGSVTFAQLCTRKEINLSLFLSDKSSFKRWECSDVTCDMAEWMNVK